MGTPNVCSSASSNKTDRRQFSQDHASALAASAGPALALPATADEIDALLAAHAAAEAEAGAADTLEQSPAYGAAARRCKERYDAIMTARPTDPIAMAKQIRFLTLGSRNLKCRMLRHIADQLESMRLAATHPDRQPRYPA
jgi:hypothetical protein